MTIGLDPARLTLAAAISRDVGTLWRSERLSADLGDRALAQDVGDRAAAARRSPESAIVGQRPCRTCADRKYEDVSSDPSVSFQLPTSVSPEQAPAAVMAHEQEHVRNNAVRADREGKTATSTVTLHTDLCPECGRVYVAGGTTRTTYSRKVSAALDEDARGLLVDALA